MSAQESPVKSGYAGTRPTSPIEAFSALMAGNKRFVANAPMHPNQDAARRSDIAAGQMPFAVVFGCSDSRMAAEIVFDQGLGDLFVVRTAGHLLGSEVAASIEFAVEELDVPLIVVLGHDGCGAIKAAIDAQGGTQNLRGYLRTIVERLSPEVLMAKARGMVDPEDVAEIHIANSVDRILEYSMPIREKVASGAVSVVGLSYDVLDGNVRTVYHAGNPLNPIC